MIKIIFYLFLVSSVAFGQAVGVSDNGGEPDGSAILDIDSDTRGVLIPRIDFNSKPNDPAEGLLIYVNANGPDGTGFYYYNGSSWESLQTMWKKSGNDIYYDEGSVTIGTSNTVHPFSASLKVDGGIHFSGGFRSASPGLLYFDEADGDFKYIDENFQTKIVGTGTYNINGNGFVDAVGSSYATYNNNLVVQGSLAVGGSVNDSTIFNFGTLVIADDDIRILFDDTSNSSLFPRNDWEIEINSDELNGKDYFAIKDRTAGTIPFSIEGPGVQNAFYLSGENLGLGTDNPQKKIHLFSENTPTIRFNHSSNLDNHNWDLEGDGTSFRLVDFTNGTTPLTVATNSKNNAIYVDADGNVGFGISSPQRTVHISEALKLEPQNSAPLDPKKGDIYFDNNDNKAKCYDGTQWQDLW